MIYLNMKSETHNINKVENIEDLLSHFGDVPVQLQILCESKSNMWLGRDKITAFKKRSVSLYLLLNDMFI